MRPRALTTAAAAAAVVTVALAGCDSSDETSLRGRDIYGDNAAASAEPYATPTVSPPPPDAATQYPLTPEATVDDRGVAHINVGDTIGYGTEQASVFTATITDLQPIQDCNYEGRQYEITYDITAGENMPTGKGPRMTASMQNSIGTSHMHTLTDDDYRGKVTGLNGCSNQADNTPDLHDVRPGTKQITTMVVVYDPDATTLVIDAEPELTKPGFRRAWELELPSRP